MPNSQDPERSLLLGVLTQAILDLPEDGIAGFDWFLGNEAGAYMRLIGLTDPAIFALRLRLLLGLVDRGSFDARPLHRARFGDADKKLKAQAEAGWQSWPVLAR